tara:strand:+ start:1086 stop:1445 length:360 start_codon:yes stop_codon:yes gene_type:complete
MQISEIKAIDYYKKIKKLESFNKLRFLYKIHIKDFFNNNYNYLKNIGIQSKNEKGLGLLIINITKINPEKIDCYFHTIDKIPDNLINIKDNILNDQNNNKSIYFFIINRNTNIFLNIII